MRIPFLVALAAVALVGCDRLTNPRTATGGSSASDPSLSALTVSSGTLTPAFAPATTAYNVALTNDITTLTVTPTAGDAGAFITVNGGAVTSGSASAAIAVPVGTSTINVRVLSSDTLANRIYSIAATRAP